MLKLFTLDNLSAFSSDTVYKICLSLEEKGLQEENLERFDSYDSMFEAVAVSLEDGDHVILAAENVDFTAVKGALIPYFSLQGAQNSSIAEAIAKNSDETDIDMEAHCLSPIGAITLLSGDGLYSGFSTLVSGGRLTCIPLDFSRVDSMIEPVARLLGFALRSSISASSNTFSRRSSTPIPALAEISCD